MSGVLNDCDAILQAAPVRVIASGLAVKVQEALDAAAAAQDDADAAAVLLADIASDGKLTPGEKPDVVAKRDIIVAEQAGVEAQATALGVTTEKTAYTAAITALTTYLASAPLAGWNTIPGSTINITGTELRGKFGDVYAKKQALLNAISGATATRAVWTNISGTGKPEDGATVGAPAGTLVNGVPVANITTAVTNFNAGNDRNATALAIPTILSDGSAVDHIIRKDGSADVSFEWSWAGAEGDIDGFLVYVYQSTSSFAYTFGSTPALETVYTVPASKRAFILFGAAADLYTTFGVMAYRSVDKDVNATGAIKSPLVKPGLAAENPYRPSTSVAFAGDITGTVNGTAVATLLADLVAAKAAADAANSALAIIADDGILSKAEKSEVILKWNSINTEKGGIDAQATVLGITTEKNTYGTAYSALLAYLQAMVPNWDNLAADTNLAAETPLTAGATFRKKFSDVYLAKQVLMNAIAAKSATMAQWGSVGGAGKPADNASSDLVLLQSGTVTVSGNRVVKTSGVGAWDSSTTSRDGYVGGAYISARSTVGSRVMMGLNTDPYVDGSWETIDFAIYIRDDGAMEAYESSSFAGSLGTYAVNDLLAVVYDGSAVRYLKNGVVLKTTLIATPISLPLFFDSSFHLVGSELSNIRFGPLSSNNWNDMGGAGKPQSNATVGAPAGTNVGNTPATLIEQRANSAIAAPTGFTLTGTFGGTVSTASTGVQTLTKQLNASASGASGAVTYSWVINLIEGAGTIKISSTTDPNPVLTGISSNVSTRIGVTCTATDTSTGLSRVNSGVVTMNFGAV